MILWIKSYGVTIQMKATEQYFPVVLFIVLYKVVLTFESGWRWHFPGSTIIQARLRTKMTNLLFLQSLCLLFDRDNTSLLVSFLASLVLDWVYDVQLLADLLDKTKSS